MSVQVSYPGVYIDEFAPGAPIEGVSTSVAAFVGIAERGPVKVPTRVTSLDDFTALFGGHVDGPTPFYLPLSVEAFFRNGGSDCYVLRAATAQKAQATLVTRDTAPLDLVEVEAVAEGQDGDGITVAVTDASRLATRLAAAGAGATTLSLATSPDVAVSALDTTRRNATVADVTPFVPGDGVLFEKGTSSAQAVVRRIVEATKTLVLEAPLPSTPDFSTGTVTVRIDDLRTGDRRLRFAVPNGLVLQAAVPTGTTLLIQGGGGTGVGAQSVVVAANGTDSVELRDPIADLRDVTAVRVSSLEFDLTIDDGPNPAQTFRELGLDPSHPRYWLTTVESPVVTLRAVDPPPATTAADPRPDTTPVTLAGSTDDDPGAAWSDVLTGPNPYLDLLDPLDDISIVAIPGAVSEDAQLALVAHSEARYDRVAVIDAPRKLTTDQLTTHREKLVGSLNRGFGALYHPWLRVRNPNTRELMTFPPSGFVAGAWAKTDARRGVHKAPANVGLVGALGVETRLTDQQQGPLNLDGVNVIRVLPGRGLPTVWGARTTAGDRNWQYINIRRLFLYLEESIATGIRDSLFEPNDRGLWERLKRTITDFLTRTWQDGALFGATAKEAFYVRIDDALNPPATRKLGRLYVEIGVQPVYPAEFIVVRIGIWDGGSEITES